MLHVRSTVFVALLALGTATTTMPLDAWAKKGKKGAKKKAGKVDEAQADDKADKAAKKAAKKAARMEKAGKAAYVKGKYDDALIAFEAAYEADPQPKHLYNMARCHEQLGRLSKASDFYERYLRDAPEAEDREDVETRAELLTKKLTATMGRLDIVSTPAGADLRIEGEGRKRDVKTPWSGWLEPGRYELSALLQGHDEYTQKLGLSAGENRKVEIDFAGDKAGSSAEPPVATAETAGVPKAAGEPPAEPTPEPAPQPTAAAEPPATPGPTPPEPKVAAAPEKPPAAEGGGIGTVPLAAFGLAAVGLASWGVFGGLHLAKSGELQDAEGGRRASGKTRGDATELADSANFFGAVANVSLAAAAAAGLTGGAILLFTGTAEETAIGARWTW